MTRVLCTEPFHNPHFDLIYDAMVGEPGVRVVRACVGQLPEARQQLGWEELPEDAPYLQPWRWKMDRVRYLQELMDAHVVVMPAFPTMWSDSLIRRATGKPVAIWSEPFLHHPRQQRRSALSRWVRRRMYTLLDAANCHLLTTGEGAESDYRACGIRRWRAWRLAYVVEPADLRDEGRAEAPAPPRFLYVGSLCHRKGVDLLLDAFRQVASKQQRWHLRLIGEGDIRPGLEKLAKASGMGERIDFAGVMGRSECLRSYGQADVLILPSRFDGWGAVVNEAMERGLAIIASSRVGAAAQLVRPGINGYIFEAGSASSLAACLEKVLSGEAPLEAMKRASLERIRQFRPEEVGRRLARLCRYFAGHAPHPGFRDGIGCEIRPRQAGNSATAVRSKAP